MNKKQIESKLISNLSYSIRRYYVDIFYSKHIRLFSKSAKILDIGGLKNIKRGLFNINKFNLKVKYLNLDPKTNPDFVANANNIPLKNNLGFAPIGSSLIFDGGFLDFWSF